MKLRHAKIFCFVAAVVLLIYRVFETMIIIEPETGFFKPEFQTMGIIGWIGMFAILVLSSIFFSLTTSIPKDAPKNKIMAIVSILMGIVLAGEAILYTLEEFSASSIVYLVLALIAIIFFIVYAICSFVRAKVPRLLSLLILPVWIYKILSVFISYSGMATISESAIKILSLSFCLLFFTNMGKVLSNVFFIKNSRKLLAFGFVAAILCFLCSIPGYVVRLINNSIVIHEPTDSKIAILFAGIFILAFMLCLYQRKNLITETKVVVKHKNEE